MSSSFAPTNPSIGILVNVDLEPSGAGASLITPVTLADPIRTFSRSNSIEHDPNSILAADPDFPRTYQNQTAQDIESGRARMDSAASYG
jgi:hypothetical protein